ncbi:MAG: DUF2567 domain-containing protein, partial [Mycobacteriaceae bacterium]
MNHFWRASIMVCGAMAGIGLCLGLLWGLITPGINGVVVRADVGGSLAGDADLYQQVPGVFVALTGESSHFFDSLVIFCGFSIFVGIFSALAVWSWRSSRGIEVFCGLFVGSILSAYLAMVIGNIVVQHRFGIPDLLQIGHYYTAAPSLVINNAQWNFQVGPFFGPTSGWDGASWLAIVPLPLVVSVVYLVSAALNLRDDLGVDLESSITKG